MLRSSKSYGFDSLALSIRQPPGFVRHRSLIALDVKLLVVKFWIQLSLIQELAGYCREQKISQVFCPLASQQILIAKTRKYTGADEKSCYQTV